MRSYIYRFLATNSTTDIERNRNILKVMHSSFKVHIPFQTQLDDQALISTVTNASSAKRKPIQIIPINPFDLLIQSPRPS